LEIRKRKRIEIRGVVQGVGFRPFVYRLALRFNLSGFVCNTPDGVLIEAEGANFALAEFCNGLTLNSPALADIQDVVTCDVNPLQDTEFMIRSSLERSSEIVLVSPDVATCDDCRQDFTNPADRRFGYPFTNCTNCGPRYSFVEDVPYDRARTTMREFRMCPDCQAEYDNPGNRRFHAQPNACPVCGPNLTLVDAAGANLPIATAPEVGMNPDLDVIREVRRLLFRGKVVAIKGLGGFHLACNAENDGSVARLRALKRRSDKPFALMSADVSSVARFCVVREADQKVLQSPRRPIVIFARRPGARVSAAVAPGNDTLGVMLPYTPLHALLFGDTPEDPPAFTALVMTSGNMSEEPIVTSNEEALQQLGSVVDAFLMHNRRIHMREDDSVVRVFQGKAHVLRRSRGYAPAVIELGSPLAEVLACGPELKNTFCLTRGCNAIVSQHIGDLENYETLEFFEETLTNLKRLFRVEPKVVAYDLHPRYLSTQYAFEQSNLHKVGVQHHHAHIASCMAENGLNEKVIGVAFDGTGYGTDGQIWGGEFLVADFEHFERRAHLRYFPLSGGNAAIRQPWRSALSCLREVFGGELPEGLPLWDSVSGKQTDLVLTMMGKGINTVMTSSCGRLFDAVASILGVRHEITFEAQAAVELEIAAVAGTEGVYPFQMEYTEPWQVDVRPMIESIVSELQEGETVGSIAARFHGTLAVMIAEVCRELRCREPLNKVCLSGGTFQNTFLLERTLAALADYNFEVYLHERVPPNDGGISLGQAVIASATVKKGV